MDVIKQIQQAIVYIEDHLLEPFNLQDLSDYVGLSPYHLDQSFKMIVGQPPESYAHSRKMTEAAKEMIQSSSRLVDVAKRYNYLSSNDFANDFSDFHGISPIQASTKKEELKMNERLYIKLTTTERAPYPYRLETTKDTPLVGYVKYIEANQLSNPYKVPDFLGVELFVGVPSERYPAHLESRLLPGRHYAKFNLQGQVDYTVNEAWYYIESSLQLTLPYEKNSLYVEIYPFDLSFENPFTKIQLWLPIKQETYDIE